MTIEEMDIGLKLASLKEMAEANNLWNSFKDYLERERIQKAIECSEAMTGPDTEICRGKYKYAITFLGDLDDFIKDALAKNKQLVEGE
ncbi:MAG: hypothetical protein KAS32_13090 [Candidatus Peribacteraceae bacterium]|nr:hypothetical protein [Candidatus Peribacteraceae bacterium]